MILIDTSVWVDHFRRPDARVALHVSHLEIVQHPFVTAELATGNLRTWRDTVSKLAGLPQAEIAEQAIFLNYLDQRQLAGCGIGFVDAHLLLSCETHGYSLWTRDRRLAREAEKLSLAYAE